VLAPLSLLALIAGQGASGLLELALGYVQRCFDFVCCFSRLRVLLPFELYTSTTTMATSCVEG
jgi:hypothetical protein